MVIQGEGKKTSPPKCSFDRWYIVNDSNPITNGKKKTVLISKLLLLSAPGAQLTPTSLQFCSVFQFRMIHVIGKENSGHDEPAG